MLVNLMAEMARYNVSVTDIARLIARTPRATKNRIYGSVEISSEDIRKIRDKYFKQFTLDYLLDDHPCDVQPILGTLNREPAQTKPA